MYKGRVRALVTDAQIQAAVDKAEGNYAEAARSLSDLTGRMIDRALVNYWYNQLANGRLEVERGEREVAQRVAKAPERPSILDQPLDSVWDTTRILSIPDLHAPYHHPHALDFIAEVQRQLQPTLTICTGDEVDNHALSFHDSDPNLNSAGPELAESRLVMRDLATIVPTLELVHSNHGSLHFRRAKKFNIPVEYLKSYIEVLFPDEKPNWRWHPELKLTLPDGSKLLVRHGEGVGSSLIDNAGHEGCNMLVGHWHSKFESEYTASSERLYWAVYSGCLIDEKALAFEYGRLTKKRPVLGCVAIVDSHPRLVPMLLNSDGAWTGEVCV